MLLTALYQAGAAGWCSGLTLMGVERGSAHCIHCKAQEGSSLVQARPVVEKMKMSSSEARISLTPTGAVVTS